MSTKRVSPKSVDMKPEADKAKRVFRTALDCIKRVDETLKQKKAYRDVFLPDAINMRCRLQDYCERLMFYDPLEYGRKAEELLWRKVYYDIIQLMKHNRKQMRPSSSLESAFRTHLTAAMGYYHHLLFKLQCEYNLHLEGVIDFYRVQEPRAHKKPHQLKKTEPDVQVMQWAERACHRCLVYLGDLARYQQDYDGIRSCMLSQRYYYAALHLCPDVGMPHNQLGTLAGTRTYNLDAAYHYLRCLTCWVVFDGAHGNLTRLFEKNRKRYAELSAVSPPDVSPEQQRSRDIRRFLVRFLHLVDIFLVSRHKLDTRELQECCQNTLQDFNSCMFHRPPHVTSPDTDQEVDLDTEKASYLSDNMVFKVMVICVMINYQLQKAGNKQVTAAIAFSLALFSHILNHVVIRLQTAIYTLENPPRPSQSEIKDDKSVSTTTDATDDDEGGAIKSNEGETDDTERGRASSQEKMEDESRVANTASTKKQRRKLQMLRRRRRRRRDSESTSESNQSGFSGDDSDLSEGEGSHVCGGRLGALPKTAVKTEGGEKNRSSGSDSEEEVRGYLNQSGSSDSDSDDLMVSQELRPGFSISSPDDSYSPDIDIMQKLSKLNAYRNSITSMNGVSQGEGLLDPTEYLKDLSVDLASDTSALFSSSAQYPGLFRAAPDHESQSADIRAVVQGTKEVRVPPGFEKTSEMQHVKEITEKLNNFVIETDTDTTSMPTDTENSSLPTESELETETDHESAESVIDKAEMEHRRLERVLHVVGREGLLLPIKVYCDWLRVHPHIIATCAQSSQSLWSRLSVLLNFFPLEEDMAKPEICDSAILFDLVRKCALSPWRPNHALPEDVHLRGFPPLADAHKSLVFDEPQFISLLQEKEAIVRMCCLRKFGHYVSKLKSIQFDYDWEEGIFYGPLQLAAAQDRAVMQGQLEDSQTRRNQLMKDMAQLRLQAEVTQLEGSLQSADHPNLPPYLVPDGSALCEDLVQMKQLVGSGRFVVIIPLAVVDQLDFLKKESVGAREAIRWLEAEFHKGNRFVRAQKNHEKVTSIPHKNLKKRDKDAWRFRQILDCCKYFTQQSADPDAKGFVCVLIGHHPADPELSARVKHAIASAQVEGVSVQNTVDFHNKWKEVLKSNKG